MRGCNLCGVRRHLKAFELVLSEWLTTRCGTARAKIDNSIRTGFEASFMTSSGRWEMEKFRQVLAKMDGIREARAGGAGVAVGPAPMALG